MTVKKYQGISNLTISADLHGRQAPAESLNWKNQFPRSQKHTQLALYLKIQYFEIFVAKGQDNLQNTKVNINLK